MGDHAGQWHYGFRYEIEQEDGTVTYRWVSQWMDDPCRDLVDIWETERQTS